MFRWIILIIAAWYAFGCLRLIFHRVRLAVRLKRLCTRLKLRLKWVRPTIASLFARRGEIDFTIDDRVCCAILTVPRRRVICRLTDNMAELIRIERRYTSGKAGRLYMRPSTHLHQIGRFPHSLAKCDLPAGVARVAIFYPVPEDVADCRGSQARSVGSGEELPGGFQFNTRTHFFERLEEYAKTGDMAIWMARKPDKE